MLTIYQRIFDAARGNPQPGKEAEKLKALIGIFTRLCVGDKDISYSDPNCRFFTQFDLFCEKYGPNCPWRFPENSNIQAIFWLNQPEEVKNRFILKYQALKLCSAMAATVFVEYYLNINSHCSNHV
jgi:hypothetical protein